MGAGVLKGMLYGAKDYDYFVSVIAYKVEKKKWET